MSSFHLRSPRGLLVLFLSVATGLPASASQAHPFVGPLSRDQVQLARDWVKNMRANRKGPYVGIQWYCDDGTIYPPKSYMCADHGGGKQYAVHSDQAEKMRNEWGVSVGTILARHEPKEFREHDFYFARAFIVEQYLERSLNGWTLEKGKTYRGFRQIEDEEEAAEEILSYLLKDPSFANDHRALAIRLVRAMPYGGQGSLADKIRALAGTIGDADPSRFGELRFKIHSMPEPSDIRKVQAYAGQRSGDQRLLADELAALMTEFYSAGTQMKRLAKMREWIWKPEIKALIDQFTAADTKDPVQLLERGAMLLQAIDGSIQTNWSTKAGQRNLLLLHTMGIVEELWLATVAQLDVAPLSRRDAIHLSGLLVRSAEWLGILSAQEGGEAMGWLFSMDRGQPEEYQRAWSELSRISQWSRARYLAELGLPLQRYAAIEPAAHRVLDDILRSGVLLPMSKLRDRLGHDLSESAGKHHRVKGFSRQLGYALRGENAGLAVGPLRRVTDEASRKALKSSDIALLYDLPPDLPPVAGILTVGGAGGLSHVSLLARNLGIPHVSLSEHAADELARWGSSNDDHLALGCSSKGRVLLGPAEKFKNLVDKEKERLRQQVSANKAFLRIDEERLDTKHAKVMMLAELKPEHSGRWVGPKAAELARLKALFPDRVSGAAVIPFGAFVKHVSFAPEGKESPLQRLQGAYTKAKSMDPEGAERFLLAELAAFRKEIMTLPFAPGFEAEVATALGLLGKPKTFGVFVRSDTNVEDLKEFTGAGLNKTIPHRVGLNSVLDAVRKVWASPYEERSFRWRQKLLVNPEYVFPSVLLHRSLPSEKSGVLVTADLTNRWTDAITVSVSEGVAAVVDGGAPEMQVVHADGRRRLLSSGRASTAKALPKPPGEGVDVVPAKGLDPVLSDAELEAVRAVAQEIRTKVPNPEGLTWDVEFGLIEGKVFLFQIRPLRTSKMGSMHPALVELDQKKTDLNPIDLRGRLP